MIIKIIKKTTTYVVPKYLKAGRKAQIVFWNKEDQDVFDVYMKPGRKAFEITKIKRSKNLAIRQAKLHETRPLGRKNHLN